MTEVDVGSVDDFARPQPVRVGGRDLIVYRWGGEFVALRNRCPHQNLPFTGGQVFTKVSAGGSLAERVTDPEEPVLVCPLHRYEFDRAGICLSTRGGKALRVKTYPTSVRVGRVYVDTSR
jgi:nitrite reductase/ring-hydroxylating ferredoxin subunit